MKKIIIFILLFPISCFSQEIDERYTELSKIENFSYNEKNKKGILEFIQLNIEAMNKKDLRFFYENPNITKLTIYPEKALFPKAENETATVRYQDILKEVDIDKGIYAVYSSYLYKNKKNRWSIASISVFSSPPITINAFNKNDFLKLGITDNNSFSIKFYQHTEKKLTIEKKIQDTRFVKYETTIKNEGYTLSLTFIVGKDSYNPNDKYPYKWNTLIIEKME